MKEDFFKLNDPFLRATESDSDSDGDEDSQNNLSMNGLEESFSNDKRTSRNQNEKNRRDLFNGLIQDLGSLINSKRKIDKASVLNEAIIFFQNNSRNKSLDGTNK